jgi:hypothetical protein
MMTSFKQDLITRIGLEHLDAGETVQLARDAQKFWRKWPTASVKAEVDRLIAARQSKTCPHDVWEQRQDFEGRPLGAYHCAACGKERPRA